MSMASFISSFKLWAVNYKQGLSLVFQFQTSWTTFIVIGNHLNQWLQPILETKTFSTFFSNNNSKAAHLYKVSISPTFYEQLFLMKVFQAAFLYLRLRFVHFWRKEIDGKAVCKMLVKLTPGKTRRTQILQFLLRRWNFFLMLLMLLLLLLLQLLLRNMKMSERSWELNADDVPNVCTS